MEHKKDAALDALAELGAADMAFDETFNGNADRPPAVEARLIACDRAFAHAIPGTAAGMRAKAAHVSKALDALAAGDTLTESGAALLKAHVESLLAGALAFRVTD